MTSRVNILTIVGKRLPPASSAHKEYDQDYNDDNAKEENGHPNLKKVQFISKEPLRIPGVSYF